MLSLYFGVSIITPMNEKRAGKRRIVKMDPEALHKAQVEVLRSKRKWGGWLEEAIQEKVERTKEP